MTTDHKPFFLDQPPNPDDLEGTITFLRPRSREDYQNELLNRLSPPPQDEEEIISEPSHIPRGDGGTIFEAYDIDPEEFVHTALEQPELWDDADVQRLYDILEGEPAQEGELEALAEAWLTGRGTKKKEQQHPPSAQRSAEDESDLDPIEARERELDGLVESPNFISPPDPSLRDLKVDLDEIGEWWKK